MGKIIWIASYPKSGSTWLQGFLGSLFTPANAPLDRNTLNQICPTLIDRALYDARAGKSTQGFSDEQILRLRHDVQKAIHETARESIFVKTNSWFGDEQGTPLIEPEFTAGAIYLVRNPIDVAAPAAQQFGVSVDDMVQLMALPEFLTAPSAKHVVEYIGSWSKNVASWTWRQNPKVLVVRYEDLTAAPEAKFGEIVAFLGLKPSQEKFDNAVRKARSVWLIEEQRGREGVPQPLIDAIKATHGEQMARFGYA